MTITKSKELYSKENTLIKGLELISKQIVETHEQGGEVVDLIAKKMAIKKELRLVQDILNGKVSKTEVSDNE